MGTEQQPPTTRQWDGILRRSIDIQVRSINEEERSVEVVASTDTIDGHGDIVEQTFDLKRYKKNPVVLWLHNSFGVFDGSRAEDFLPIGRSEKVKVADGQLEAKLFFATADANPMAEKIWQLVKQDILRAVSIGFRPGKVTRTEDSATGKVTYRLANNELFEISVVPIPSNPDAVAKSLSFEREQLSRIAAKTADSSGEEEATMAMSAEEKKEFDAAIVAKGVAEAKASEATSQITKLEGDVAVEKAAVAKAQSDLAIANTRLEKAEKKIMEIEVDALVGKKITPAQREKFIKLRSAQGEKEFGEFVADMPELPTLKDITGSDPTITNSANKKKGVPTKMAAALNKAEG